MTELRSPLHDEHVALGAALTALAGWQMPLRYTSDLAEHTAVRTAAGLFDLSHMGELAVTGGEAVDFLRYVLVSDPATLEIGQAQYSMLCTEDGGIIDDVICYRTDEGYLVVCNASNRETVVAHLSALASRWLRCPGR